MKTWYQKLTRFVLLASIISPVFLSAAIHEDHPYSFTISSDPYAFSTYFQINSNDSYIGTIKKSSFRIRTNYDLSDENGWQATGIVRVLSLGSFYTWAREIDVYDTRGVKVGMIDGQVGTTEGAKFSFYEYGEEENYTHVGTAYLDGDCDSFTIFPPSSEGISPIVRMGRVTVSGGVDFWEVNVHRSEKIDDRMVRIFAAFVLDHQSDFQKMGQRDIILDDFED